MKKMLIVCTRFPYPVDGGDKLRIFSNINYLKKKFQIDICYIGYEKINYSNQIKDVKNIFEFLIKKKNIISLTLDFLFSKNPLQISIYHKKYIAKQIEKKFQKIKYDVVIFHLLRSTMYYKLFKSRKKYLDNSDSLILNYKRLFRKSKFKLLSYFYLIEAKKIFYYYSRNLQNFQKIFYISKFDLKFDRKILNLKKTKKFFLFNRNRLNTKKINLYSQNSKNLLFIANFKSVSNLFATYKNLNLIRELKRKNKKINIYFCGNKSFFFNILIKLFGKKKLYLGNIENLEKCKIKFKYGLGNLVYSSGFQNKILEYINLGLPVITSREVSYGFQKKDRKFFKIYKTDSDLKNNILKFLSNKINHKKNSQIIHSTREGKIT